MTTQIIQSFFFRSMALFLFSQKSYLCFTLDSSNSSYAQFDKWDVALNGSLQFEFKTEQPNGLLLYTDDGGTYDFFEIKLVEGALRLRYNLGSGAQILTVGRELNDGRWHRVAIKRDFERTSLTVDNSTQSKTSKGKEFHFGNISTNSDVYMGGMPTWYNTKLTRLALPSVIFEPRFGGVIRNLVYADVHSHLPKRQRMKRSIRNPSYVGSKLTNVLDVCEINDPCENGGICVTTDNGAVCDCQNLDYEGIHCEQERTPSEATFSGKEYLMYDMRMQDQKLFTTKQDTVSFYFKTKHENGLLFHSKIGDDYLNIAVQDGGVSVLMKISAAKLAMYVKPKKLRFSDNRWHKVTVFRRIQELTALTSFCRVTLIVDDAFTENSNIAGDFTDLSTNRIYAGGCENPSNLLGSNVDSNFIGCMKKVVYEIADLKMDIIDQAKTRNKIISVIGHVLFLCRSSDPSDAVTFTTPESFVILPNWEAGQSGSFSIRFRTIEPHGLLVYSRAMKAAHSDLFAIELIDGHLYMLMDVGSGLVKERIGFGKINDGAWHSVNVTRTGKNGRVSLDDIVVYFITPGEPKQLDLGNGLFLGGLPWQQYDHRNFPVALWSATLKAGFVGCVSSLTLNKEVVDIMRYAQKQDTGSIDPFCRVGENHCTPNPCYNYGECINGWNRFICDCELTDFNGPSCSRAAPMVNFNGSQSMVVRMPPGIMYQVEDLIIRFKSPNEYGLLFATTHQSSDYIEIALFAGKIRMVISMGGTSKIMVNSHGLGDNLWHTAHYVRFGDHITLTVDNQPASKSEGIYIEHSIINVGHIHIGGYSLVEEGIPNSRLKTVAFTGSMQKIQYNGYNLIDAIKSLHLRNDDSNTPIMQLSGTYHYGESRHIIHRPFTFLSKNTYVGLPAIKMYSSFNIYFQFKTKEPSGLILYNSGKRDGFFAAELMNGHMQVFIQTSSELLQIKDESKTPFNDDHWHAVSIEQITMKLCILYIDEILVSASRYSGDPIQLHGLLYVGGIPTEKKSSLQKQIHSTHGFQGCLANLHLNSETPDLIEDALIPSMLVTNGCQGVGKVCNHNVCENGGTCFEHWNNAPVCDCSMTSYTGSSCSEYSIAYEFGPGRGLITYRFAENQRPETVEDSLAVGFITLKDDAVLFRIDSFASKDYLELEIVEGNIFVVYNVGMQDIPIGETSVKINDNRYHIVRFTRKGSNSTLQLDDLNVQYNIPSGQYLSIFDSQSTIQVGGKWNNIEQRIERPFAGIVAGLVFNGMRILDLTYERYERTEGRGDITKREIVSKNSKQLKSTNDVHAQQKAPITNMASDDLIYSGAGSSCDIDDEDRCKIPSIDHGDEIVTPVYVKKDRVPPTPTVKVSSKMPSNPCNDADDEDCISSTPEHSGDGPDGPEISPGYPPPSNITVSSNDSTITTNIISVSEDLTENITEVTTVKIVAAVPGETTSETTTINTRMWTPERTKSTQQPTISSITTVHRYGSSPATTIASSESTTSARTSITFVTELTPEILIATSRYPFRPTERPPIDEGSTNPATLIILISVVLMVAICIIIGILLLNRRSENNYKIDDRKIYQQEQKSVLLPPADRIQQYEGNKGFNGKLKRRQDVKEWYV